MVYILQGPASMARAMSFMPESLIVITIWYALLCFLFAKASLKLI